MNRLTLSRREFLKLISIGGMMPMVQGSGMEGQGRKPNIVLILPDMLGESRIESDERSLFWVRREGGQNYGGQAFYAARCGDWKLLQNTPFEPLRLYNLADDPQEENPLDAEHEQYRVVFTELQKHIIRTGAVPWQRYPVEL